MLSVDEQNFLCSLFQQADIQTVEDVVGSAVDVMQAMASLICYLLSKLNSLLFSIIIFLMQKNSCDVACFIPLLHVDSMNMKFQARSQERLERKKAKYVEKIKKNKVALIHKSAEEKRAMVEAKRGEDLLKANEVAAKYRATGNAPKKLLGCFGN
ncbi:hypothetical protein HHK36_019457 [Tetracentron sinense]|uniref:Remorin C-terminal domain-containing protein n=1 Tax=Tetracentron sinense TaxID=13715 RepID=A0A835DCS4_TETSI|nr:hypothetical protein HHK36_019457 [Tetracentron sinense]